MRKLLTLILSLSITFLGCRKAFNPESIGGFNSALIVEGVINTAGVTNIYLSRTLDLDDKVSVRPELKATVQILSENNTAINLLDKGLGLYSVPQVTLNSMQKYRLRIRTATGVEYISDPIASKNTPAIDSLNWVREADGVHIYVNAHDSQNKTQYYQWDFEEDWEIRSVAQSYFKVVPLGRGYVVVDRDPKETPLMDVCYKNQHATNIDIFSTSKLKSDLVSNHPIVFIPNGSDKLSVRYSIIVRQYALTFEAFEYLTMMKKNSEQLGSFFDSQPTELIGNIRNASDPKDIAIGYVSIAPIIEKRIFINREQVLTWGFNLNCGAVVVKNVSDSLGKYMYGQNTPVNANADNSGRVESWNGTADRCMDCRLRGGNNNKPAYW